MNLFLFSTPFTITFRTYSSIMFKIFLVPKQKKMKNEKLVKIKVIQYGTMS